MKAPFNLGAGHAISRGTLRAVGPRLPGNDDARNVPGYHCPRTVTWAEDWEMGRCLNMSGVGAVTDSRDARGRETFMAFLPKDNFMAIPTWNATYNNTVARNWFWKHKPVHVGNGTRCCSTRPVLWHNLKVKDRSVRVMYEVEYWLYGAAVDPVPV